MKSTHFATPSPVPGAHRQRPRVALCEADSLLCALLEEWLSRAGFEPLRCAGAEPPPDVLLVVADVPAPRQDGVACIAALRSRYPHAGVLAISAQFAPGMQGSCAAAVELGADAVLAKPFTATAFIGAVRDAMLHLS